MTAAISKKLTHQLRLFGIHAHLERRALEAESSSLHPCEFLSLLLEDEVEYRKEMTAKRLKSRAGFGREAALEEWDQSFERGLSKAKLRELAMSALVQSGGRLRLNPGIDYGRIRGRKTVNPGADYGPIRG